jgi:hypothetical protein
MTMKKHYPIIIMLLLATTSIIAQPKLGVGVKAGVNIANQKGTGLDYEVDNKSIAGFVAGGYVHYFFSDAAAIQIEILFSQKGSDWSEIDLSGKDILNYLEIPLLIRYQIIDLLNIHAGPQFGFMLSSKTKYDDGYEEDASTYFKSSDVGLAIGAELNLPFRVNITVRYIIGLSNIATEEFGNTWKNNVFQATVGFRLIGK